MIDLSITEKLTKLRWYYSSQHLKKNVLKKERPKKVIHHIWGWKPDLRLVDAEHDLNITKWVNPRTFQLCACKYLSFIVYLRSPIISQDGDVECKAASFGAFSHFLASRLTQLRSLAICKQSIWRHLRYVLQEVDFDMIEIIQISWKKRYIWREVNLETFEIYLQTFDWRHFDIFEVYWNESLLWCGIYLVFVLYLLVFSGKLFFVVNIWKIFFMSFWKISNDNIFENMFVDAVLGKIFVNAIIWKIFFLHF